MKKVDEKEIIRIFQTKFGNKKLVSEDVEFFRLGKSSLVFNIDSLVQSTDIPPGFKLDKVARKSIVACISDFAAKGVQPKYGFISIIIPKNYSKKEITELANGFAKASKEFGFKILGGDTNAGKELSLNVCLIGESESIVGRNNAKKDDIIFVTGPFGYTAAGLKIILGKKKSQKNFKNKAENSVYNPKSRLSFGLAVNNFITSSMDSSDGLSTTLNEMAKQSKKKFQINKIPRKSDLEDFAKLNRIDPWELVFNGGEEYEFVFTVSHRNRQKIINISKKLKVPIIEIGRVVSGNGVKFESEKKTFEIKDEGWRHFRS